MQIRKKKRIIAEEESDDNGSDTDLELEGIIFYPKYPDLFRRLDIFGRLSAMFSKGDRFYDFLFAFLHTIPLLNRDLL